METLPFYIPLGFIATVLLTFSILYRASDNKRSLMLVLSAWLLLQGILTWAGFYQVFGSRPPRFVLLTLPPVILISMLFATAKGRAFLDGFDMKTLSLIHIVRIPVELILFALSVHHAVPRLMTFEGGNLDILSGISAPVIWYFGYQKQKISRGWLIAWNLVCLGLLFNIVVRALLSLSPSMALVHFPYSWLPGFVVPAVLLTHLVALRQLIKNK